MTGQKLFTAFVLLAVFATATPQASAALVAHWTFDDSSNRYADWSGNGNTLTPVGTVAFTPGQSGDALRLANAGKAVRNLGSAATMSEFSIAMWAYTPSTAGAWDDYVEIGVPGGSDGYVLERNGSQAVSGFNVGGISGATDLASTTNVADGWHHLALVADTAANRVDLYVDGVSRDNDVWSATAAFDNTTVGGRYNTGARNINADIDDVQIYDSALTGDQIDFLSRSPGAIVAPFVYEEDYEDGTPYKLNNGNANVSVSYTSDPESGGTHGTVAAVDHSISAGQWGEVRAQPIQNLALPSNMIGGQFTLTVDYYVPASTRFGAGDSLALITRWNDGDVADFKTLSQGVSLPAAAVDTWHTATLTGTVPATETDGDGVTHVIPFLSWSDVDPDVTGGAGIDAYFDNFRFEAVPESSALALSILALLGLLGWGRRRR